MLRFDVQPLVALTYLVCLGAGGASSQWSGDGFHGVCFAMSLCSDLCVVGLGAAWAFPDRGDFSGTEHQQN